MIILQHMQHGFMIAHRAGTGFDPNLDKVISRVDADGKLLGGIVYTEFTGRTVRMHMAGAHRRWATLELIWLAFDYPFNQLQVERVLATVPSTNAEALKIDRQLGFKDIAVIPDAVPFGDLIVLSMMRNECRWLNFRQRFLPGSKWAGELAA